MKLAEKLGLKDYPNPSGGCLLTDPRFAERVRDHLKHERKLTLEDILLLRIGRHFRIGRGKVIVGRNAEENKKLLIISKRRNIPHLEVIEYKGPITLLMGEENPELLEKAASITVRYSDSPKSAPIKVRYKGTKERILKVRAISDEELEALRI